MNKDLLREDWEDARRMVGIAAKVVAVVGTVALVGLGTCVVNDHLEFGQVYRKALLEYADTNRDSLISVAEQDEFDRKLLQDKGVTLIHGHMPKYKDGTSVPVSVVTEWIRNYKP